MISFISTLHLGYLCTSSRKRCSPPICAYRSASSNRVWVVKYMLSTTQYRALPAVMPYVCRIYWRISVVLPTPREPLMATSWLVQLMSLMISLMMSILTWEIYIWCFLNNDSITVLWSTLYLAAKLYKITESTKHKRQKAYHDKRFLTKTAYLNKLFTSVSIAKPNNIFLFIASLQMQNWRLP